MTNRDAGSVVIVGAGIIGLAIGLRLQLAGRKVTLIDREAPGRGCSFGNVGRIANESVEPLASLETLREQRPALPVRGGRTARHPSPPCTPHRSMAVAILARINAGELRPREGCAEIVTTAQSAGVHAPAGRRRRTFAVEGKRPPAGHRRKQRANGPVTPATTACCRRHPGAAGQPQ
ncbi:MAG: FAD-dependent oxidoreductase [Woeseiaceae bacterium]|nr:FAD-dependent oxidoreductase [Woeseiaceae bacterium]